MSKLSGINEFVQVAHCGSFVAAGRVVGISASAVGKSVARLEQRLGTRLFHRSTRSLHLTAEGSVFLARCLTVLEALETAETELAQSAEQPAGRLRISLPVAGERFCALMVDFMQAYPAIQLDLDFNDRQVDVIEDGFDAVIRTGALTDSRLITRALGSFDVHLLASPGYLQRNGTPASVDELPAHACLFYKLPHTGRLEPWPLGPSHEAVAARLTPAMSSNSLAMIVTACMAGRGIACLPDFAVSDAIEQRALQVILPAEVHRGLAFSILWPSHRFVTPKLRCFVDFVSQHVQAVSHRPS